MTMKIPRLLLTIYLRHSYRMEGVGLAVGLPVEVLLIMTSLKLPRWPKLTVVHRLTMMVTSITYRSIMLVVASAERAPVARGM